MYKIVEKLGSSESELLGNYNDKQAADDMLKYLNDEKNKKFKGIYSIKHENKKSNNTTDNGIIIIDKSDIKDKRKTGNHSGHLYDCNIKCPLCGGNTIIQYDHPKDKDMIFCNNCFEYDAEVKIK